MLLYVDTGAIIFSACVAYLQCAATLFKSGVSCSIGCAVVLVGVESVLLSVPNKVDVPVYCFGIYGVLCIVFLVCNFMCNAVYITLAAVF